MLTIHFIVRGAGHLYGTSLPIGGRSTHAVITAHRGLIRDELFTHLDGMKTGDEFVIHALDGDLHYRVDSIAVINPDDVSKLLIRPGEDRVTLMTCTPYGVIRNDCWYPESECAALRSEVRAC